jgi:alpha-tubulin suppressor-like RCC1 family protein
MNGRGVIGQVLRFAALGLVSMACSRCESNKKGGEAARFGRLSAAVSVRPSHDIDRFQFKVLEPDAQCTDRSANEVIVRLETKNASPSALGDGAGASHLFASNLFILQPGEYLLCVAPLRSDGTPSNECSPASAKETVFEGVTTEAVLVSNCMAEGSGGVAPVVIVNDPPHMDGLVIKPGTFISAHQSVTITLSARDVDADAIHLDAAVASSPPGATFHLGIAGSWIQFVPNRQGEYQIKISATDAFGASASIIVPIHVNAPVIGGSVWAWGDDSYGQLGIGYTSNSTVPIQVNNLTEVVAVSGGWDHSLALDSTGRVWAWGGNSHGQLGDGTSMDRTAPVLVSDLTAVVAIAGGMYSSLALDSSGRVWSWGLKHYCAFENCPLGRSSIYDAVPVQVSGLTGVVAIANSLGHSLAIDSTGRAWVWGRNTVGVLGDEVGLHETGLFQVRNPTEVIAIAAGWASSYALDSSGRVWGWGLGGQPVQDRTDNYDRAVQYPNLSGIVAIGAGENHSLALDSTGAVWAWGCGAGDLGPEGELVFSSEPLQVKNLTGAVAIAGGECHGLALDSTGKVWGWGRNQDGELGDGTTLDRPAAVQVKGLSGAIGLAGGGRHSLASDSTGRVWAWGSKTYGQLGDGTMSKSPVPAPVRKLSEVRAIAGGVYHSLASDSVGRVWAWGNNADGQLGDGTTINHSEPVQVKDLSDVVAVAGGEGQSLALDSTGKVWAWGANSHGQLGNGTTTSSSMPVHVNGLTEVVAISAGSHHGLASDSSGRVWSWGRNEGGQLGDGTTNDSLVPVQVKNLARVVAVAGRWNKSMALDSDGHVWVWGRGGRVPFRVEDVDSFDSIAAIATEGDRDLVLYANGRFRDDLLKDLAGIVAIAKGDAHSLALDSAGKIWSWGWNLSGQLGDGTTNPRIGGPVLVSGIAGAVAIAGGGSHSLAILKR